MFNDQQLIEHLRYWDNIDPKMVERWFWAICELHAEGMNDISIDKMHTAFMEFDLPAN